MKRDPCWKRLHLPSWYRVSAQRREVQPRVAGVRLHFREDHRRRQCVKSSTIRRGFGRSKGDRAISIRGGSVSFMRRWSFQGSSEEAWAGLWTGKRLRLTTLRASIIAMRLSGSPGYKIVPRLELCRHEDTLNMRTLHSHQASRPTPKPRWTPELEHLPNTSNSPSGSSTCAAEGGRTGVGRTTTNVARRPPRTLSGLLMCSTSPSGDYSTSPSGDSSTSPSGLREDLGDGNQTMAARFLAKAFPPVRIGTGILRVWFLETRRVPSDQEAIAAEPAMAE